MLKGERRTIEGKNPSRGWYGLRALAFLCLALLSFAGAANAQAVRSSALSSYKVNFTSDSIRINLYFTESPEVKRIISRNRLEYWLNFANTTLTAGDISEAVKDPLLSSVKLFKEKDSVKLLIRQQQMTQIRLLRGFDRQKNKFYVSVLFYRPYESYSKYETRLLEIEKLKKKKVPIVVIDAGHGGKDPGAKSVAGDLEKNLNLKFAREVADGINETGLCKAYLTRYGDQFLSLGRRVFLANQYSADAFVSIHFNANRSKKVRGFEVYYLSSGGASDKSAQILADIENSSELLDESIVGEEDFQVQSILLDLKEKENIKESGIVAEITTRNIKSMGDYPAGAPKQANFAVLRNLNMPSVLIEMGYLSNSSDLNYLKSRENFEELCSRIALGIISSLCREDSDAINAQIKAIGERKKAKRIPEEAPAVADAEEKPALFKVKTANEKCKIYTVKQGDTLLKISKKFSVPLKRLLELNNKTREKSAIHPGEKLKVPDVKK